MNFYFDNTLLTDEEAFRRFGEIRCLERLDVARDYFNNHSYANSIEFTDGMEIRRDNN